MGILSVNIKRALDKDEMDVVTGMLGYLNRHSSGDDALRAGEFRDELAHKDSFSRKELNEIADLMYQAGEVMMVEVAKKGELLDSSFAATVMDLIGKIRNL